MVWDRKRARLARRLSCSSVSVCCGDTFLPREPELLEDGLEVPDFLAFFLGLAVLGDFSTLRFLMGRLGFGVVTTALTLVPAVVDLEGVSAMRLADL